MVEEFFLSLGLGIFHSNSLDKDSNTYLFLNRRKLYKVWKGNVERESQSKFFFLLSKNILGPICRCLLDLGFRKKNLERLSEKISQKLDFQKKKLNFLPAEKKLSKITKFHFFENDVLYRRGRSEKFNHPLRLTFLWLFLEMCFFKFFIEIFLLGGILQKSQSFEF